ncbi:maleylacetate reductase [Brevibacterium casei]|uniref:Maleylacetate reductase n=2 Tax=Brevibacterium casei TaxID=33889 RepID=A0A2H1JSR0_9MICO|nr:maleylacetate reductase [Brevibacterium casei]PAK96172.1 maleylacetate reductase [Brevibacterium casei]QPR39931.1 maleylacetate reductase [Brevibacterium casei]QPR44095.1 maleylacetate reductase [Brevibacterium casei]SMX90491.1 maleylacetate reductase [Brevibacterium casei CIP 102111]
MSLDFTHTTLGQRVVFAPGQAAARIAEEIERLGAERIMVIVSGSAADKVSDFSSHFPVALWHREVVMHVPAEVADRAVAAAQAAEIDLVVSVGGGSATGLAKAVALETRIPIIAVPTTFAGSEATNVWGRTENARKRTGTDDAVLPRTVVYDATLLADLPHDLAVASGLNALAHCIDSMWAPRADPINRALALEGIRALTLGLPQLDPDGEDLTGLEDTLYGAYLAAVAFASAGSGMHHKIAHVLGGTFDLPHAQTHATLLPYVLAFNAPAVPEAETRMAKAFGAPTAVAGLERLREAVGAPRALSGLGFTEADIAEAVDLSLDAIPEDNPRAVTKENLTALLTAALRGDEPTSAAKRA